MEEGTEQGSKQRAALAERSTPENSCHRWRLLDTSKGKRSNAALHHSSPGHKEVPMLKTIARRLPALARDTLRHAYHSFQIARGTFRSPEPEWDRLAEWLGPGDIVLDIGANIGHYALRMSELVGPAGRIIAVEPAPENFAALTANSRRFRFANVTLLNLAIGDKARACGLSIPTWPDGTPNGYLARIDPQGQVSCLAIRLDALELPGPVRLAKIDAEGYEARVLDGMRRILERDRPVVLLERNAEAEALLESIGYAINIPIVRSPNIIALPVAGTSCCSAVNRRAAERAEHVAA
jgi:FkbM family methyltransferase